MAIIYENRLIVANVGDSRGVMYSGRGLAVPLSFDHKPQQASTTSEFTRNRLIDSHLLIINSR